MSKIINIDKYEDVRPGDIGTFSYFYNGTYHEFSGKVWETSNELYIGGSWLGYVGRTLKAGIQFVSATRALTLPTVPGTIFYAVVPHLGYFDPVQIVLTHDDDANPYYLPKTEKYSIRYISHDKIDASTVRIVYNPEEDPNV